MVIGISTLPSMILIVATWMVNSAEPITSVMELSAELIASVKRLSVSAALKTSYLMESKRSEKFESSWLVM